MINPDYDAILKWYRGKALAAVRDEAIPLLKQSVELGWWVPKASRRVRSLIRKTHRTQCSEAASQADEFTENGRIRGWHVLHGLIDLAPAHLVAIRERCAAACGQAVSDGPMSHLQWCLDFAPIAELLTHLDEQRPKPVYVVGNISPTVMTNVGMEMGLALESVRCPEVVWELVDEVVKGQKVKMWVGRIIWPDGTIHNASRFAYDNPNRKTVGGNDQCHACGHAIKSGLFVPILADSHTSHVTATENTYSLWIGRDCARNLFGLKIEKDVAFIRSESVGVP